MQIAQAFFYAELAILGLMAGTGVWYVVSRFRHGHNRPAEHPKVLAH